MVGRKEKAERELDRRPDRASDNVEPGCGCESEWVDDRKPEPMGDTLTG
jgi:hypothetical protein